MIRTLALGLGLAVVGRATPAGAAPTKEECVANNESAQDLRSTGRLQEARRHLLFCTAASCPAPVRDDCAQRLAEVDANMPSLIVEAKDSGGNKVPAARVTLDGRPWLEKLDGTSVPVDPGEHRFVVSAPGFRAATRKAVVREGEAGRRLEVLLVSTSQPATLAPEGPPQATPIAASPAPGADPGSPDGPPAPAQGVEASSAASAGPSPLAPIGVVVGGIGLTGILVGGVLGVLAKTTEDRAADQCPTHRNCSNVALDNAALANGDATFSTVAFVGGGVLLAAGAAMWLLAPRDGPVKVGAIAGPGGGRVSVSARW
ncbi:MAG: hypothetical protein JOZ69_21950 [Myxococcales bacterium]|nr:hypothetical protein [Myxococcales bacterium]